MGHCYDNETEILTLNDKNETNWKYFADLDRTEKVASLNQESGEMEWELPTAWQVFDNNKDMYNILLEDGSELLVSEKHKVYSGRRVNTSLVLNTSTKDCLLNNLSLDQIGSFNFSASAKKSISLKNSCFSFSENDSDNFSACLNDLEYSSSGMKSISIASSFFSEENSSEDIFVFDKINDSYLFISFNDVSGETNLCFVNISLVGEFCQKKLNNMLVSTTNSIYNSPFFFNSSNLSLRAFLPNSTVQSVNPDSSSCLSLANISRFQASCFALDSMQVRTNADQFSSGDFFISSLISDGMDSVIDTICVSPVDKRNYVELYKSFGLERITKTYSDYLNGEEIYFLDSNNESVLVKGIKRVDYSGKIYDVDVGNDVVLVRRNNGTAVWSGNSNDGSVVNAVWNSSGGVNETGGFSFDGSGDYVDFGNSLGNYVDASPMISICLITASCINVFFINFSLAILKTYSSIFFIPSKICSI